MRDGRVYVMEAATGRLKVGFSTRPERRMLSIEEAETLVYQTEDLDNAEAVEREAHRILRADGRHIEGEWFSATRGEAVAAVRAAVSNSDHTLIMSHGTVATPGHFRTALAALRLSAGEFAVLLGHSQEEGRIWSLNPPPVACTIAKFLLERPESLQVFLKIAEYQGRTLSIKSTI